VQASQLQSLVYSSYEGDFPRLSTKNSLAIDGLIFYLGSVGGGYVAWEYKSKVKIVATNTKERLALWLQLNIDKVKERLNEYNSKGLIKNN